MTWDDINVGDVFIDFQKNTCIIIYKTGPWLIELVIFKEKPSNALLTSHKEADDYIWKNYKRHQG